MQILCTKLHTLLCTSENKNRLHCYTTCIHMLLSREMLVALGVGIVLVSGAFYVGASDETIKGDITVVAKPPERNYIAPKDSDGDGISDWAEELIKDREEILSEFDQSEPYVPPSTLTQKFSVKFFQDYLYSKGFGEYGDNKDELAAKAIEVLSHEAKDSVYTIDDIVLGSDDSQEALHQYGNRIAQIVIESSVPTKNNIAEMDILEQAMETKNEAKLAELDPIIEAYQKYFDETKLVTVPPSLVRQHIDLINVYSAVLKDLKAMRLVFEDPLLALLRVKRYPDDVGGMVYVYYNIDRVLRREGITYSSDEPGELFKGVGVLREIIQKQ